MELASLTLCAAYLFLFCGFVYSTAIISPPKVASVCRGHQLELTCNVTGSFLQWSFSLVHEGEMTARLRMFTITSNSPHDQTQRLRVNSTTMLIFSRSSAENIVPLVSIFTINTTSDGLTGTMITCSDVETSESVSTTINIINETAIEHKGVDIPPLSETFGQDSVTVLLEWIQSDPLYSYYNVSVVPQPVTITSIESGRVNFTVIYNIHYNVSIYTAPPCGGYNVNTVIELHYAKCENPTPQIVDSKVEVEGYSNPAVEGTDIKLSCSSGQVLTGPNSTALCMWNGKWEPDLGEIECKATCDPPVPPPNGVIMPYSNTLEGVMVTFMCWTIRETKHQSALCKEINVSAICNANGEWEPDLETICAEPLDLGIRLNQDGKIILGSSSAFVVTSTLFGFIIGVLCGYLCQKVRNKAEIVSFHEQRQSPSVQEDLELNINIAYGSVPQQETMSKQAIHRQGDFEFITTTALFSS